MCLSLLPRDVDLAFLTVLVGNAGHGAGAAARYIETLAAKPSCPCRAAAAAGCIHAVQTEQGRLRLWLQHPRRATIATGAGACSLRCNAGTRHVPAARAYLLLAINVGTVRGTRRELCGVIFL